MFGTDSPFDTSAANWRNLGGNPVSSQVRAGEHTWRRVSQGIEVGRGMASQLHTVAEAAGILKAVSYTHLTLPTMLLV